MKLSNSPVGTTMLSQRAISKPGMLFQHITTNEPDDSQIEVAIAALKAVIPENKAEDEW